VDTTELGAVDPDSVADEVSYLRSRARPASSPPSAERR
jgi:hypothetical protein